MKHSFFCELAHLYIHTNKYVTRVIMRVHGLLLFSTLCHAHNFFTTKYGLHKEGFRAITFSSSMCPLFTAHFYYDLPFCPFPS